MAELTTMQIEALRADLSDYQGSFSTPQLQLNWDRVEGATSAVQRHNATLALCYRQLLAGAVKLHDYQAGAVRMSLNQVYDHLEAQYKRYEPDLIAATGEGSANVRMSKVSVRPNPNRRMPP